VTQLKEVILPSTSSKAQVMPTVSPSSLSVIPEDVSSMLNDHTKHMTNQLNYMLEDGLVKIFKSLGISSDPSAILGTTHTPSSLAPLNPAGIPLYGMPKNFTPSQAPPVMSTYLQQPDNAMVVSLPIVEALDSSPSLAATS
jgi:hypothetical protein